MLIGFSGMTHLGQTLMAASRLRGFEVTATDLEKCDLIMVTQDVEDHTDLKEVDRHMQHVADIGVVPTVLVSQVPPGYTRSWSEKWSPDGNLYYQVDTIIMHSALRRATFPERFVVGCPQTGLRLHDNYRAWLSAFECHVVMMNYESAELTKLAINYYLAKQIEVTNELAGLAEKLGANWPDMIPGLRRDARIGHYLRPGEIGGHLPRDVRTIVKLLKETTIPPCDDAEFGMTP